MSKQKRRPANGDIERDLRSVQREWERMDPVEPPALIDQSVMNAARRDLGSRARKRPLRWLGGFATAAVAVLAITLVWFPTPSTDLPVSPAKEEPMRAKQAAPLDRENATNRFQAAPARDKGALFERDASAETAGAPQAMKHESRRVAVPEDQTEPFEPVATEEALRPAEEWLEELKMLREAGRLEELETGLRAFRAAYPDWPVPAELEDATP